jgi:hypothetical protein
VFVRPRKFGCGSAALRYPLAMQTSKAGYALQNRILLFFEQSLCDLSGATASPLHDKSRLSLREAP